jgi:membrane protease YdiL (CAAX protease family)
MPSIFVATPQPNAGTVAVDELSPGDDAAARLRAATAVGLRADGPFEALEHALARNAAARAEIAILLGLPCVARWATVVRWIALLGIVPLAMLAELDRELAVLGTPSGWIRLGLDVAALAFVAAELARRAPPFPRIAAIVLLASGARFFRFVATTCGKSHWSIPTAGVIAVAAGVLVFARAPTRGRITREALDAIGVAPSIPPPLRKPSIALVLAALATAAALPLLLAIIRGAHISPGVQALLFAGYGLVPIGVELALEKHAPRVRRGALRVAAAIVAAFVLTLALTDGARHIVDASAYATRCFDPAAFASGAKRVLEAQANEVARPIVSERARWALFVMNVLIVPIVEERVYRGLLQRVLARRLGPPWGIVSASLLFGLAHLGVYRFAIYQAVLLGVSFGVAYAEGGFLAAALVHAAWNLHLLL